MEDGHAAPLHREMIDRLVAQGYLRSPRVEEAFRSVPRHFFLPDVPLPKVYSGEAIVTRHGPDGLPISSSSEPAVMAVMLEQLRPEPGDRILEIGAGTGYNAALLSHLAGPHGEVTTVDIEEDVAREAADHLRSAGFENVRVAAGDGWLGVSDRAPFDRIEATVGIRDLSPHWVAQLRDGGVLVVPLWLRPGYQASIAFSREGDRLRSLSVRPAGFMRLRGPHAGPRTYHPVGEWIASLDEIRPEDPEMLDALLTMRPTEEPAPDLPRGWGMGFVLEHDDVVFLMHRDHWRRAMLGLYDRARRGLAVVEGATDLACGVEAASRILGFGDPSATDDLRARLAGARPASLHGLAMEAIPAARAAPPEAGWVIRRLHFQYHLTAGPAASA